MRCSATSTLLIALAASAVAADSAAKPPGVTSHIKVLSNHIEDVSSMEAWKRSFIKDGMSDEEKAMAIWTSVVKFRHQDNPPNEYFSEVMNVHDPIKTFNVYGYNMCCCASSNIESLSRYVGLQARGWSLNNHSVPEVFFKDAWHLLDASVICYYLKDDKSIAGVEEMSANPDDLCKPERCRPPLRGPGWQSLTGDHPMLHMPDTYRNTGERPFKYEYGYSSGYEVNVQLRPGEKLVRNWSNQGLHVNMAENPGQGESLNGKIGQAQFAYAVAYGDLAPGRIGNGTIEYKVPLASGVFRSGALQVDNIACTSEDRAKPAAHVSDASKPATIVIRMPSSYVYLGGSVAFTAVVASGGAIAVSYSDNNGLDWRPIGSAASSGDQNIDLKPYTLRRYDYRLRFELTGKGTGLDALTITNVIQHSQRPLPALTTGSNTITFSAGTQEGTVSIEGGLNDACKGKNIYYTEFHPTVTNLGGPFGLFLKAPTGDITFPVETPGDITGIRLGCHYRARDAQDGFAYQASFDDGKSWTEIGKASGPTSATCAYAGTRSIPSGKRHALIRYAGSQRNIVGMFAFAIKVDYAEPNGGFRPITVTYVWDENGAEKRDTHTAKQADEAYTITCAGKPVMKSLIVEPAP
jgi:hypothetical protein